MIRETVDEFKKSMEAMKQDLVVSIVAKVLKSMQQPALKEPVGGKKVQVIESEGGNDIRSHDPSKLDSLIFVSFLASLSPSPSPSPSNQISLALSSGYFHHSHYLLYSAFNYII